MFQRVLIVCTGNICRSPMAEALLRARLAGSGGVHVSSAGIAALTGHLAHPTVQDLLTPRGIDISAHRARQVDRVMLSASDLILVADAGHEAWLRQRFPGTRDRLHRIGERRNIDVPDPFGRPPLAYREALALLDACVEDWLPVLLPRAPRAHSGR